MNLTSTALLRNFQMKNRKTEEALKYLDGLFEKLPEDVVRNFADSEYFDMYVNVLNEIGI